MKSIQYSVQISNKQKHYHQMIYSIFFVYYLVAFFLQTGEQLAFQVLKEYEWKRSRLVFKIEIEKKTRSDAALQERLMIKYLNGEWFI